MSDTFNTPSRRDFVALGSVATAATMLSAGGVYAGGKDDVIKVGLIGCGGRGSQAAENCMDADKGVKLWAVGDAFKEKAAGLVERKKGSKKYSGRTEVTEDRIFGGLDAYQKVIDSGVDLVILATTPGFRPYHLEAAIKAGKHVFCEKPVATDAPGIRKVLSLVDEAKKKNLAVVAGTQRRHQQGYIDTVKAVHDGAIGELVGGRCYWNGTEPWFHARNDKDFLKLAGHETELAYQINNWYHFTWLCGDHITEQHVHNLDVINWLMQSHPIAASGMGGRSHRRVGDPKDVGNIFDHFAVEYEYPNGARVFSFCRHAPGCDQNVSEAVIGTKGRADLQDSARYQINGKTVGKDKDISPYVQEHVDLIRSIRENKPLNELQNVAESTMTAILGRMSTYTGHRITWADALASKQQLMPEPKDMSWDMKIETPPVAIPGKTKFV
ncbi:Gfo/Idh/MocA family oxidoreductase [Telmatocola sphagniphila]|uniref:Gfo/Idh/MocA family oxidoreductase n=1 Tax=Telmatocola sphagniphila TaxID=1123043 RepID=A0A8E6B457_9BACT|nr:Gfo/Idh/MocA family oxidoreductase [Telmatocola sphagniphila]QVL31109.1 Gfo/Idh/MocA family oxidoreductase [Telmatocola sphagniphila]